MPPKGVTKKVDEQEKMQAVQKRDRSYDGKFVFGVKTTKIVCRPGCPAKIPLKKNVVFFDRVEEAIERGYRHCKICKPELFPFISGGIFNG